MAWCETQRRVLGLAGATFTVCGHLRVEEAAELRALALEDTHRPFRSGSTLNQRGSSGRGSRPSSGRTRGSTSCGTTSAESMVRRTSLFSGTTIVSNGAGAAGVVELPVELVRDHVDLQRVRLVGARRVEVAGEVDEDEGRDEREQHDRDDRPGGLELRRAVDVGPVDGARASAAAEADDEDDERALDEHEDPGGERRRRASRRRMRTLSRSASPG